MEGPKGSHGTQRTLSYAKLLCERSFCHLTSSKPPPSQYFSTYLLKNFKNNPEPGASLNPWGHQLLSIDALEFIR